jgi:hypothetical protein
LLVVPEAISPDGAEVRVGYAVPHNPTLASYRLRVDIPRRHLAGHQSCVGTTGDVTFFYKNGNPRLAESLAGPVVYDVVNDHFRGEQARDYFTMCSIAHTITCASESMRDTILRATGRDATVIDDPWENEEAEPKVLGEGVLWFGHSANLASLLPHIEAIGPKLIVCSNVRSAHVPWSLENESRCLQGAAVVVLTASSPGASANRVIKAIRAGRFVVTPADCPASWRQFEDYALIGGVSEGIGWALNNREEACRKILAGQAYIRERFSPQLIGSQWADLFASTLGQDTSTKKAGSA